MRAREKVVGRGSRWREECKGGFWWRPVESDEERAARAGVKEEERLRRARCAEEAWARIERERGRQRQIPCLTRLGSMRSSARTPRRPRPSFLPSLFSALLFRRRPILLVLWSLRLPFSPSLFLPFSPFLFLRVPLFLSLSQSLLLTSFVLRAFMSCC